MVSGAFVVGCFVECIVNSQLGGDRLILNRRESFK